MKDIVISGQRIRTELYFLVAAYLLANILNVFSIWYYDANWIEVITFQPMVLLITSIFYAATIIVRLCVALTNYIIGKVKKTN